MELRSAALLSYSLLMLLVVWTGTAWFVALHPRFVWRLIQGDAAPRGEGEPPVILRLMGVCIGIAGLIVLLLGDALHYT